MVEKEEAPGNIINLSPRSLVMVLARKTQELPSTVDLLHAASGIGAGAKAATLGTRSSLDLGTLNS